MRIANCHSLLPLPDLADLVEGLLGGLANAHTSDAWFASLQRAEASTRFYSAKAHVGSGHTASTHCCRFPHDTRWTAVDRGCAKTPAFNLRVESSSRFGQSENQKCWRRLSEEGNRENDSALSWLAHVFTRPGPFPDIRAQEIETPTTPNFPEWGVLRF